VGSIDGGAKIKAKRRNQCRIHTFIAVGSNPGSREFFAPRRKNAPAQRKGTDLPNFLKRVVVLVVEDEPFLRMVAVDLVEEAGFEPVQAANADQAVRILEARADIRIVFTDIDMPGSMDGMKLAIAIRGRWPPIEVILTSGLYNIETGELPPRSVFFRKPYNHNEIIATIQRMAA
jgi:CheY-like chemotaxis protein